MSSRRSAYAYPQQLGDNGNNAAQVEYTGRTDYAANGGTYVMFTPSSSSGSGGEATPVVPYSVPNTSEALTSIGDESFIWPDFHKSMDGIIYLNSRVRIAQVRDGTTTTYLLGEKLMNPDHYEDGNGVGDQRSCYHGYGLHNIRFALQTKPHYGETALPTDRAAMKTEFGSLMLMPDGRDVPYGEWRFGGPHDGGVNMVFADGHVRSMNFDIDEYIHYLLTNRMDRQPIDSSKME